MKKKLIVAIAAMLIIVIGIGVLTGNEVLFDKTTDVIDVNDAVYVNIWRKDNFDTRYVGDEAKAVVADLLDGGLLSDNEDEVGEFINRVGKDPRTNENLVMIVIRGVDLSVPLDRESMENAAFHVIYVDTTTGEYVVYKGVIRFNTDDSFGQEIHEKYISVIGGGIDVNKLSSYIKAD